MKKIILLLLLLPTLSQAGQVVIGSADLPYTATVAWDTITFNANKITTSGTGIIINASNVTVDLQDDTLEFGTGYSDNVYGIDIFWNVKGVTILGNPAVDNGGLILHGGGTGVSDSSWDCNNIRFAEGSLFITDVDMELYGWDGHNVGSARGRPDSLVISGGSYVNHLDGFTSRGSFDASAILGKVDYLEVDNLNVDCWHDAIYFERATAIISNCSLYVDAKNDLYYPGDPWNDFYKTSALSGGIQGWIINAGTQIFNNYIEAGVDNEGCEQGIALNYCGGTEANPILVYNNVGVLHRGPDDHYGNLAVKGIKTRWHNKHVNIYDNEFYITLHSDSGAHAAAWGTGAFGLDILYLPEGSGEGKWCDSFIVVERNHIEVVALSAGCNGIGAKMSIRPDMLNYEYDWVEAGNIWRNNYFKANQYAMSIGGQDGGRCIGFLASGDTLASDGSAGFKTYSLGYWEQSSYDNIVKDMVYLGGAVDTSIYYWPSSNDGSNITIQKTLDITVLGNNSLTVYGASVTVVNGYGKTVLSGTTNSYGRFSGPVSYWFDAKVGGDSTNFNNFSLTVQKGDDTYVTDIVVDKDIVIPTINLLNTAGNGDSLKVDTIPPDPVDDLGVVPGKLDGSVILSWIATGDDGKIGTASSYEIIYSTNSISNYNWAQATNYTSPPKPKPPGSLESLAIDNLTPGLKYYFGVIAYDNIGTKSDISFASGYTRGSEIIATGIAETKTYAYPNPVRFSHGEIATFILPEEPSDLLIQSISGKTVLLKSGLTGIWEWDGKNESGADVAMGIYLWYVNGNDFMGKLVVKQ